MKKLLIIIILLILSCAQSLTIQQRVSRDLGDISKYSDSKLLENYYKAQKDESETKKKLDILLKEEQEKKNKRIKDRHDREDYDTEYIIDNTDEKIYTHPDDAYRWEEEDIQEEIDRGFMIARHRDEIKYYRETQLQLLIELKRRDIEP